MHFLLHCEYHTDIIFKRVYHIETHFSYIEFYSMDDSELLSFIRKIEYICGLNYQKC